MPEKIKAKGIDVSYAQGIIDWKKIKQSCEADFAILRATASYPTGGRSGIDTAWKRNIENACAAEIPVGAYHYSYAENVEEIKLEAAHFLRTIAPYQFEYPVCLDFEESFQIGGAGKTGFPLAKQMDMIDAFLRILENAGYFTALYSTSSALARLNAAFPERMSRYTLWVAHVDVPAPMVPGGIWQHSWNGKLAGISGDVDLNYAYEDYPSIIRAAGKNGFSASASGDSITVTIGYTEAQVNDALNHIQAVREILKNPTIIG